MTARDEIKILMAKNEVTYKLLAKSLHINFRNLYYQLNLSSDKTDIDLSLYMQIMEYFNSRFPQKEEEETCGNLISESFKANQIFAIGLERLNREIAEDIKDKTLQQFEKLRLRKKLEDIKKDFDVEIFKLLSLTK